MTFLYLNSDRIGQGEPALGKKLLRTFLIKLAQSSQQVDFIGCINSAVNLTTTEDEALEALKILQKKGARIATCGTCLDYYNKRNELKIGEIGSMDDTIEIMFRADKTIRPN